MNAHSTVDAGHTGPAPHCATSLSAIVSDRDFAHRLAGALQDLIVPEPSALTVFEQPGDGWRIEAYYDGQADANAAAAALEAAIGTAPPPLTIEPVPDANWVALSQAALPPVTAGRFTVHGSHDAHRVAQGPNAILIDAGEAFGTAHLLTKPRDTRCGQRRIAAGLEALKHVCGLAPFRLRRSGNVVPAPRFSQRVSSLSRRPLTNNEEGPSASVRVLDRPM
jgi:hypothetical protein